MKYKMTIVHRMLVVYRTTSSLHGGRIYKRVDVMAVRVWCLLYISYFIFQQFHFTKIDNICNFSYAHRAP